MIPKRFIRTWLGPKEIPQMFEDWWAEFKVIHPDYEFITIGDDHGLDMPDEIKEIYDNAKSYSSRSDIIRIMALYEYGGIYVDTDVMPIKSFDELIESDDRPFAGKRSSKSFEAAVLGSPKGHPIVLETINALPSWYAINGDRSCAISTGPAFISSVWFGREEVRHLPTKTFYPYNGFGAPKRDEKMRMFTERDFPAEMICAHFSNHRWGGKPKTKVKT